VQPLLEQIRPHLERNGYRARTVSSEHIKKLQEGINKIHRQGLFDEEFYQERLTFFEFRPPESLPQAKTLIIVAMPQPQAKVTFTFHGEPHHVILPPTYASSEDRQVLKILSEVLCTQGYSVVQAKLPVKSLAVHSGLGRYGRNNICYIPGMGSFHRLAAFYTNCELDEDNWQDFQVMQRCLKCQICLRSCPTGAISRDRFLVHAERCITFHNERSYAEFPAWIDESWHNCLVGCMRRVKWCQDWLPTSSLFKPSPCSRLTPEGARFHTARWRQRLFPVEYFSMIHTSVIVKRHMPACQEHAGNSQDSS